MKVGEHMIKNKKGFTVLEAIASVFIVSLVLTTTVSFIVVMRNQAIASEQKQQATDIASSMRDELLSTLNYMDVEAWLGSDSYIVDEITCNDLSSPIPCRVFNYDQKGMYTPETLKIVFPERSEEAIQFRIIRFYIEITYYNERTISIEGIIYE